MVQIATPSAIVPSIATRSEAIVSTNSVAGAERTTKMFLVLLGVTSYIPVNFIGTLKAAEIIALIYVVLNATDLIAMHKQFPRMKVYFLGNFLWLLIGSISTYYNVHQYPECYTVWPPEISFAKGFANIIVVYASTMVFTKSIGSTPKLVPYYLIPCGLSTVIFSPYYYSLADMGKSNPFSSEASSIDDNYFDVTIAPILTPILIASPFLFKGRPLFTITCMIVYGLLAVTLESRANGLIFILSALALTPKMFNYAISLKVLLSLMFLSIALAVPTLKFLLAQGWLGQKGSEQALKATETTEKFNPTLLVGRPAATVATFAILDSPIIGHGFNKQDRQFYTNAREAGYLPSSYKDRYLGISAHSNILNAMVEAGILAGIVWIAILYWSFSDLSASFEKPYSPDNAFRIVCFFFLLWSIPFSGTLRLDIGYFIAPMLLRRR